MNEEVNEIKKRCLAEMKEICQKYTKEAVEHGYSEDDFEMIILEQWRPW